MKADDNKKSGEDFLKNNDSLFFICVHLREPFTSTEWHS